MCWGALITRISLLPHSYSERPNAVDSRTLVRDTKLAS